MKTPRTKPRRELKETVIGFKAEEDLIRLLDIRAKRQRVSRSDVMRQILWEQLQPEVRMGA